MGESGSTDDTVSKGHLYRRNPELWNRLTVNTSMGTNGASRGLACLRRVLGFRGNRKNITRRRDQRRLAVVALEKENDPLQDIDLSEAGLTKPQKAELVTLLEEFRDIFAKNPKRPGRTDRVRHEIDTGTNRPINVAPYRLGPIEKETVAEEIKVMQENDVIRPSRSPWAAPVVLVTKKDGTIRFCVDYRKINAITKKDVYPLPRIDDALDAMHGAAYFSTLDLASGYWQVEMDPNDREKTAFICDQGLFEFNVMPFGLCNAPATFQRLMDAVLAGLKWTTCLVYLDDIIIFSKTFERAPRETAQRVRTHPRSEAPAEGNEVSFRKPEHRLPGPYHIGKRYRPRPREGPRRTRLPHPNNREGPTIVPGSHIVLPKVCEKLRQDILPALQAPREERVVRLGRGVPRRLCETQNRAHDGADPPLSGLH